jgi:ADP-ribose pyrophosphatase
MGGRVTEIMGEGRYLRLLRRGTWEYVERPRGVRAVCIVAVTGERRLVLVEQHRPPVDGPVLELPAGLVGDERRHRRETIETAARRELLEETGYEAHRMVTLTEGPIAAGLAPESTTIVQAFGLIKRSSGGGTGIEAITVHEAPLRGLETWLRRMRRRGILVDLKIYAGLCLLRARR